MESKQRHTSASINGGSAIDASETPYLKGWATAWVGVVVLAFVNGVLHRLFVGALGEHRAHQVSTVVLLILLAPWVWRTERHYPLPNGSAAAGAGLLWAAATVIFEFLFGHYINKDSWAKLLNDYDLAEGRLWLVDVIGIATAPALARAWRLHRNQRTSSQQ